MSTSQIRCQGCDRVFSPRGLSQHLSRTPNAVCYVLVERSARLELDGYDLVVWHVVLEAFASDTR